MKQKSRHWIYYILISAALGGILYDAAKDITPITRNIEKTVEIKYGK